MSTMVPMYGFGGGIDNLKFRVYAATSLPASGRENDVCIITSTPIPSWEVGQVDDPTWSMAAGFVYLTCTASDASQPNLLRKNALYLKLTRCWQYESGKWATKNAYQYRNGAWVQFSTTFVATINITYPAGSTCTATNGTTTLTAPDTSGTWKCIVPNAGTWRVMIVNVAGEDVNVTTNNGTYTVKTWYLFKNGKQFVPFTARKNGSFANNVINANGFSSWSSASVSTTNMIRINKFSKLVFAVQITNSATSDQSPNGYYGISTENMIEDDYRVAAAHKTIVGTETLTVDVSKISGSYYAGVKTWKVDAKVSQIYLVV